MCLVPVPQAPLFRLGTRPLLQKEISSPTQMSVHKRAGLAARAPPDATPASDCAQPGDKSAPHTTKHVHTESQEECLALRGNLADSTTQIPPIAVRSDRFGLRFAEGHRRVSFSGSRTPSMYRIFRRRCGLRSSLSDYCGSRA